MFSPSGEKYILVAGLGKSGISAAKFFNNIGYKVVATDINPAQRENPDILALEALGVKTETGFHNIATFENAQMIVASPGIPLDGKYFQRAIEKGIPIRGEMDIAAEHIKEPIVAITGTNGKTTVTTLISEMLKSSGLKVFTGGNIGTPLIEYLNQDDQDSKSARGEFSDSTDIIFKPVKNRNYDVVVVEVSSFQLDTAHNFCPDVALLLNITEDHLNRYADFRAYEDSKWSIFSGQNENCHAIINRRIDTSTAFVNKDIDFASDLQTHHKNLKEQKIPKDRLSTIKSKITYFNNADNSEEIFAAQKKLSKLKGKHNQENIEASILAALCAGASMEGIEAALKNFRGLAHRIEYVATISGVDFYNDSKGTNTDATARAVEAFDKNTILIMGGQDKNMDFSVLKEWLRGRVKKIVLMGEAKDKIYAALYGSCDIIFADNMKNAVSIAFENAVPGDTVLLSPACASFDMYLNYAERGEDFTRQVKNLL